jgi:glycosyltransferase involved in cell wall biosynthesis
MAAGVPVVSTNAGGLGEINIDGVTGFMGNIGDVATMSQQAIAILKDEDTLQQFKNNAAQQALKFDIHNIVPLYEDLYQRFLPKSSLATEPRLRVDIP